jgi:hypothetical protein|uniref:Uncharacterized protein n=2 Tax=Oryza TaxID=4527 RepID=A0A0D3FTL5_9ORYZ
MEVASTHRRRHRRGGYRIHPSRRRRRDGIRARGEEVAGSAPPIAADGGSAREKGGETVESRRRRRIRARGAERRRDPCGLELQGASGAAEGRRCPNTLITELQQ